MAMSKAQRERIEHHIRNMFPFRNSTGTMYGKPSAGGYIVKSYAEPIAWFENGQWYMTPKRFSDTTAKHQQVCRVALQDENVIEKEW